MRSWVDTEPLALDDRARRNARGGFIALRHGAVHVRVTGQIAGPNVILIGGLTTPLAYWDAFAERLASRGYRVVQYDLYGRGLSARVDVDYTPELFATQLDELLRALYITTQVDLIGASLGAAIALHYALRHPDRIRALSLHAPAGAVEQVPLVLRLLKVPVLGELAMIAFGTRFLRKTLASEVRAPRVPKLLSMFDESIAYRGSKRAILSTLRHFPLHGLAAFYREGSRFRVQLIWGIDDQLIPFAVSAPLRAALCPAELHALPGVVHMPAFEDPPNVAKLVADFLDSSPVVQGDDG